MLLKFIFLSVLSATIANKISYDDHTLYKLYPDSEEHLKYLKDLYKNPDGLNFWKYSHNVGDYVNVLVEPEKKELFEHSLTKRNINYNVVLENIQQAIDDQIFSRRKRDTMEMFWTNYQTMEDIYEWFYHLAATHSDIVTVIHAGVSAEGRNITGVRISRGTNRPAFFIEGGQIAADWLSPTVVTYLVDQLVKGDDPEGLAASEEFDWHIFPILNPDGHEFTQNRDRLWIKNRRQTIGTAIGVDLTKNWNSQWGIGGGSFVPSDHNYIGLGPFSEMETRAISQYIHNNIASNLTGLLSFRGYGQRLIIPFAHTTQPMYNYEKMRIIGSRAMGSLAIKYGTLFRVGTSMAVYDGSTGSIADWAKHRFNPPIVATYQLRDEGSRGYVLPVNQVLPSCEETFDSVMAIIREAKFIDVL